MQLVALVIYDLEFLRVHEQAELVIVVQLACHEVLDIFQLDLGIRHPVLDLVGQVFVNKLILAAALFADTAEESEIHKFSRDALDLVSAIAELLGNPLDRADGEDFR